MTKPIALQHELDAAWIIALWKAIHNGDPSPEQIALQAIAALSLTIVNGPGAVGNVAEFQGRLKEIGVEFDAPKAQAGSTTENLQIQRTYCIVFKGQRICITLPVVKLPPPTHQAEGIYDGRAKGRRRRCQRQRH